MDILSIEPGLMFWTVLIFLIFVFLLRKFAWGPIVTALDEREKNILDSIESAERSRDDGIKILAEQKDTLRKSREEAKSIIAEARAVAGKEGEKVLAKTRAEADQVLERAKAEIRNEEAQAVNRVREEAVDIAMSAAAKLIQRTLGEPDQRRLVEEFISQVSTGKKS